MTRIISNRLDNAIGPYTYANGAIQFFGTKAFSPIKDVLKVQPPSREELLNKVIQKDSKRRAIFHIWNALCTSAIDILSEEGSIFSYVPTITRMISSPGAITGTISSDVDPFSVKFFESTQYLSQSSQLFLEIALALDDVKSVFCLEHTFRNEIVDCRHLPEFYHLEYEANTDFNGIIYQQEIFLGKLLKSIANKCEHYIEEFVSIEQIHYLSNLFSSHQVKRITYDDASQLLIEKGIINWKGSSIVPVTEFGIKEEVALTEIFEGQPIWLTNFPTDQVAFYHKSDPKNIEIAINADLLFPGYGEVIGCGERIQNHDELVDKAIKFKLDMDDYKPYLQSRLNSNQIHSGWGMGIERLLQAILSIPLIWDAQIISTVP